MFKKAMLLSVALSIFLVGNVQAGFTTGGWGYCWGCGSIVGTFELRGTGKTSDGDMVSVVLTPTNIEYICKNPGNPEGYFIDGTPGQFNFTGEVPIDGENTLQKNGKVTVKVDIDIENQLVLDVESGLFIPLYDTLECVNPNWTVLVGSVVPSDMDALAIWLDGDGTEKDRVEAVCTLDPILRHPEGTFIDDNENGELDEGEEDLSLLPIEPQTYNCVDITDL